jgi:hypothetical protein
MSPSQGWRALLSNAMNLVGSLQQTGLLALMQCACFVVGVFACLIASAFWKATSLFAATVPSASLIVSWRSNSAKWPPIKRSSLICLSQSEALSTSNWKISRGRLCGLLSHAVKQRYHNFLSREQHTCIASVNG